MGVEPVWRSPNEIVPLSEISLEDGPVGLLVEEPTGVLRDLGVEPGDIVTSLNGISLTSPLNIRHAVMSALPSDRPEAVVQRHGATVTLRSPETRVELVSPTVYRINRAFLDDVMESPRTLARHQPELTQTYVDGAPAGVGFESVPHGSFFLDIGIQRTDTVTEVNGQPVTTPQRFIEVWEAFQSSDEVMITLVRRGRERVLTYHIGDWD